MTPYPSETSGQAQFPVDRSTERVGDVLVRNAGSSVRDKELAFVANQMYPGRDMVITVRNSDGMQIAITSNSLSPTTTPTMMATMQGTLSATAA